MDTVTLPYKLQIWLSDPLRDALKDLACAQGLPLQKLVVAILEHAVAHPLSLPPVSRPGRQGGDKQTC
jgi:hypothetical protein